MYGTPLTSIGFVTMQLVDSGSSGSSLSPTGGGFLPLSPEELPPSAAGWVSVVVEQPAEAAADTMPARAETLARANNFLTMSVASYFAVFIAAKPISGQ